MSLIRILRYGIQGFRRNIWLSIIAIITMTLTITTITIFALTNVVANHKYEEFNNKIDYNIFIQDKASDADVTQLRTQIDHRPEVSSSDYISKEQAKDRFDSYFGNVDALRGIITADNNPLPREIDVKFTDPKSIDQFNTFITQDRFSQVIERTSYQDNHDLIANYVRLTNFFRIFALSFTIFFLFIAILVILNTIRLAIFARREEVEIMRLVGATSGYIRGPFLVEGALFGVIGALVSGLLAWVFLGQIRKLLEITYTSKSTNFMSDLFGSSLGGITSSGSFNSLLSELLVFQIIVGLILGMVCSFLAVRRYLKE